MKSQAARARFPRWRRLEVRRPLDGGRGRKIENREGRQQMQKLPCVYLSVCLYSRQPFFFNFFFSSLKKKINYSFLFFLITSNTFLTFWLVLSAAAQVFSRHTHRRDVRENQRRLVTFFTFFLLLFPFECYLESGCYFYFIL